MSVHFAVRLSTPFVKPDREVKTLCCPDFPISKFKNISFQVDWDPRCLLDVMVDIRPSVWYNDHAGFTVDLGLFGLWTCFTFYDGRHALKWEGDEAD